MIGALCRVPPSEKDGCHARRVSLAVGFDPRAVAGLVIEAADLHPLLPRLNDIAPGWIPA